MPPKKVNKPSKAEKAKKEKANDDKTFGMKNKNKSAKVQRYIQQVNTQAKHNAEQRMGGVSFNHTIAQRDKNSYSFFSPKILLPKRRHSNKRRERNSPNFSSLSKPLKKYLSVLTPRLFFVFITRQETVREAPSVSSLTT